MTPPGAPLPTGTQQAAGALAAEWSPGPPGTQHPAGAAATEWWSRAAGITASTR